jgi:DNA-binding transcriptional LysR family regulator
MTKLQITYFITAARCGNFTHAAQMLYVSQPTITQQITSLEHELGFQLFERYSKYVQLTPSGKIMLDCFCRFEDDFSEAFHKACRLSEDAAGNMTIGFLTFADMPFSMKIKEYCTKRNIPVKFLRGTWKKLYSLFVSEELDLVFMFDNQAKGLLSSCFYPLYDSEYKFILSQTHPLAAKEELDIQDLMGEPFLVTNATFPKDIMVNQRALFEELGLSEAKYQAVPDIETLFTMVESGLGYALADEHNTLLDEDRFRILNTGLYHKMGVVWHENRVSPQVVQLLKYSLGISAAAVSKLRS